MLRRSNPAQRVTPLLPAALTRSASKLTRTNPTGPKLATVDGVLIRDNRSCAIHGGPISGTRGLDWSVHHRRPRRMGGDRRPDTNLQSNLAIVCGSGTTGCHGHIESRRADAIDLGWLLHADDVPSQCPMFHGLHGWVYLTDDGRLERTAPPVLRGDVIDLGTYPIATPMPKPARCDVDHYGDGTHCQCWYWPRNGGDVQECCWCDGQPECASEDLDGA